MNPLGALMVGENFDVAAADRNLVAAAVELLRIRVQLEPDPAILPVDYSELFGGEEPPPSLALARIAQAFGLSRFESALLLCFTAISVDPALAAVCTAIQGQSRSGSISIAFVSRLLPEAHLSAMRPDAPLRFWRLIEPDGSSEAVSAALFRIDERVLFHLIGSDFSSDLLSVPSTEGWLSAEQLALAPRLADLLVHEAQSGGAVLQVCGEDPAALRAIIAAACRGLGLPLLSIPGSALPGLRSELAALAGRCNRDLALAGAVLLIEPREPNPEATALLADFAELIDAPVIVAASTPLRLTARASLRFDLPPLTLAERRAHWDLLAPGLPEPDLERIARTFQLDGPGRAAAARLAGQGTGPDTLWDACRVQSRDRLDGLSERVVGNAGWEDLVLPPGQGELLRDIVDHVAFAGQVFEHWGFDSRLTRGTGVAALFAGPSGTGKTLAAEVLANSLRRDLYRIDLSQVVSKYIGETEKNLSRIFAAAEGGGAILLFDEADALFGKRSDVQDSHDRYANIEVSYLLQRMETYSGLSILTTNLKDALDKAFLRRLRFIVQFAYPNAEQRRRIWERALPAELPVQGLDFARLAQLDLTGGAIRNVALAAAFLAARDGGPLTMAHLAAAATREYHKLEKPLGGRGMDWNS